MDSPACPRDGTALRLQSYWKHPRHHCGECRGLFLGEANFVETLGSATLEAAAAGAGGFVATAAGLIENLPESRIACPRDATPMHVLVHKGVEIDVCPACRSVWLDDGEYAKIAALAAKPVDPAQRRSLEVDPGDALDIVDFVGEALGALFDGLGSL